MTPLSTRIDLRTNAARFDVRHFFLPAKKSTRRLDYDATRVSAIIPTYVPGELAVRLVEDLIRWNPRIRVYVVDDCTPLSMSSTRIFERIASVSNRVTVLRTSSNKLKAGALNIALEHIYKDTAALPEAILTLDDDVVIAQSTVRNIVTDLLSDESLGAVCSQCRVYNKNVNLLTRLQGLEYVGFNAIRLSDEGFYRGPLVMHGMLTAFRASALQEVGGFQEGHLIEDYEVTTRLKEQGWSVCSAQNAPAWTAVPETLSGLWRQRTRWSYGGITVVAAARRPLAVFQDLVGHSIFLSTLGMVAALFCFRTDGSVPFSITGAIIVLSLLQFAAWYFFQLFLMRFHYERDAYDWAIRITIIPEIIYSYLMTSALIGSYLFHLFNVCTRYVGERQVVLRGRELFRFVGYTERHWGTRRVAHSFTKV